MYEPNTMDDNRTEDQGKFRLLAQLPKQVLTTSPISSREQAG